MGNGASSSARLQKLHRQIVQETLRKKEGDEDFLNDPEAAAVLKQQVQECLQHVRSLKEQLSSGVDPNSPELKASADALRKLLSTPNPVKSKAEEAKKAAPAVLAPETNDQEKKRAEHNMAVEHKVEESNPAAEEEKAAELDVVKAARVTLDGVRERIRLGFCKREDTKVWAVFESYASYEVMQSPSRALDGRFQPLRPFHFEMLISRKDMRDSLKQLHIHVNDQVAVELFDMMDVCGNIGLDKDEFQAAVKMSSQVSGWARALPLAELLEDALPKPDDDTINPLLFLSSLTDAEIGVVVDGMREGLERVVRDSVAKLAKAFEAMRRKSASQFQHCAVNKFEVATANMKGGTLHDFHNGIEGRVGCPHLDFEAAMEQEHCSLAGCKQKFLTDNYRIESTPEMEWRIVVLREPPRDGDMRFGRRIPKIDELLHLQISKSSGLIRAEVIALVLYTGPMFHIYNTVLRQRPEELFQVFKDGNNLFPTTIHVLASAVQKISRVMRLPKGLLLYRGLSGVAFPHSFLKCDMNGCSGFTEWGFMSTTSNKSVAIKYSGVGENKPLPMMLVIRVSAVDRGACIRDFSQYVDEVEYLWVPASFLEQEGSKYLEITDDGVVQVHPVKVNANLKTSTTEELVKRKKNMHLAAFKYRIEEVEGELQKAAHDATIQERLAKDPTRSVDPVLYTISNFIKQIVEQCQEVLVRHQAVDPSEYTDDSVYRRLVLEMVDVKVMALSKLKEWIENVQSSFIQYRFKAALRTVHRRRIAYLQRRMDGSGEFDASSALTWCQIKGLVGSSVEDVNELNENPLMIAAAEGRSMTELRFLVQAGAKVNGFRPDGVTAMWLAAQFGHTHCIRSLVDLQADVNQAANDGATPTYIAAQSGYEECIAVLAAYKADVNKPDNKGLTPVHQAAINGHSKCIVALAKLRAELDKADIAGKTPSQATTDKGCQDTLTQLLAKKAEAVAVLGSKKLIISSGDVSDVDGFLALAEYSKTGADVLFVMNYPAYINESAVDDSYDVNNPGQGYKYGAQQVFDSCKMDDALRKNYEDFLERYHGLNHGTRMKAAMSDLAHYLAKKVWTDLNVANRGDLFFCIGGVNSVNPFSATAIKNEIYVYSIVYTDSERADFCSLSTIEGAIYDIKGSPAKMDYSAYSDVLVDFNGSMAFLTEQWMVTLRHTLVGRIRGVFVMGGVYADETPKTMPAIPGVLNRFSSATMNQLYHPARTAELFTFLAQNPGIPVFTITNNVVDDITTFADKDRKVKTFDGVEQFLQANQIAGEFVLRLAHAHYESVYNPPRKPFDFYTALALTALLRGDDPPTTQALKSSSRRLFFCEEYALTFVGGAADTWHSTLKSYVDLIDTSARADDAEFIKQKKEYFLREIAIMRSMSTLDHLGVFDVSFSLDIATRRLSIASAKPRVALFP